VQKTKTKILFLEKNLDKKKIILFLFYFCYISFSSLYSATKKREKMIGIENIFRWQFLLQKLVCLIISQKKKVFVTNKTNHSKERKNEQQQQQQ
jgi:hypothetical protein